MIQLYNELVSHLTNGPPIAWNLKDLAEEFLALKRKNNEDTSGIDDFMYSLNEKEESWYLYRVTKTILWRKKCLYLLQL